MTCPLLFAMAALGQPVKSVLKDGLRIVIVEGDGAINNVAARTAREPVVKVQDAAGKPVTGAVVTFTLPSGGPGASFLDGKLSLTKSTDADGLAAAKNLTPNKNAGQFAIRVTATANGETARATILQTNAVPATVGSPKKKIVIATVVAGAVAGGVLAATMGKSSSSTSSSPASVVPGSPTFIPPR